MSISANIHFYEIPGCYTLICVYLLTSTRLLHFLNVWKFRIWWRTRYFGYLFHNLWTVIAILYLFLPLIWLCERVEYRQVTNHWFLGSFPQPFHSCHLLPRSCSIGINRFKLKLVWVDVVHVSQQNTFPTIFFLKCGNSWECPHAS